MWYFYLLGPALFVCQMFYKSMAEQWPTIKSEVADDLDLLNNDEGVLFSLLLIFHRCTTMNIYPEI